MSFVTFALLTRAVSTTTGAPVSDRATIDWPPRAFLYLRHAWNSHPLVDSALLVALFASGATAIWYRYRGRRMRRRVRYTKYGLIGLAAVSLFPAYNALKTLGDFLGFVLGIGAILLAVRHVFHLEELVEKLGTRLTPKFPVHLEGITKLVKRALPNERLHILADCADYGSFSNPSLHMQLVKKIIGAASRGVSVSILSCGPLHHINKNSDFWGRKFHELMEDRRFKKCLRNYMQFLRTDVGFKTWLDREILRDAQEKPAFFTWLTKSKFGSDDHCALKPTEGVTSAVILSLLRKSRATIEQQDPLMDMTAEVFECVLYAREKYFEDVWLGTAAVSSTPIRKAHLSFERAPSVPTPLFFWLRLTPEEKPLDAIFMFTDVGKKTRGLGFATRERQLLRVLTSTFADRMAAAEAARSHPGADGSALAVAPP